MIKKKEVIKMFDNEIKIVNKNQVVFYLKTGVSPIRIELGYNDRLVFVYLKEETTEVWEQWKKHVVECKLEQLKFCNNGTCNLDYDYDDYFFNE